MPASKDLSLTQVKSNQPFETDLEPHPIMWTPRPNAVRFSIVTDSRHMLAGSYANRIGLSPLNSRFSCASRSALVIRGCAGA